MRYNANNSKNPAKIIPWDGIYPSIRNRYESDEILPVGLSKVQLLSLIPELKMIHNRGRFLSDRRIKVRPSETTTPSFMVEFNFEDFIVEDIGGVTTLNEIDRVLGQVEVTIREEVTPAFHIKSAQVTNLTMFRHVTMVAEAERTIRLLNLLSRDRGGQDLESPVMEPRVAHWGSGSLLVYSRNDGKQSSDADVKKRADHLRIDQIRFEVRNMCTSNYSSRLYMAGELSNWYPQLLHHYASYCEAPFSFNLRQLHGIEFGTSRQERMELERKNPDYYDQRAYRPFKDESTVELIKDLKLRLFDYYRSVPAETEAEGRARHRN